MDGVSREAARASGRKRYFTGVLCRNGHLAERAVSSGACLACLKEAKERFADRNGRRFRRNHGEPERKAAKAAGMIRYSTGEPCRNGHLSDRFTSTGRCVKCDAVRHARWLARRPGLEAEWAKRRRKLNPDAATLAAIRWQKKNPERVRLIQRAASQRRRARKNDLPSNLTTSDVDEIFARQSGRCAYCRKKAKKMEIDHIVPVKRNGPTTKANSQLLCRSCNRRKSDKDPLAFAQERGLLL